MSTLLERRREMLQELQGSTPVVDPRLFQPFTITCLANTTIGIGVPSITRTGGELSSIKMKIDNGSWFTPSVNTSTNYYSLPSTPNYGGIDLTAGQTLQIIAEGLWISSSSPVINECSIDSINANTPSYYNPTFEVSGNIMSLVNGDNFGIDNEFHVPSGLSTANCCFTYFFNQVEGLGSAENLVLPATTVPAYAYYGMFRGYRTNYWLRKAPDILPATTLGEHCYREMFTNQQGMSNAPILPATTLADSCYRQMFQNCTNLTTAPVLPATTLVNRCYHAMFRYCSSLNYIKAMFTTTPSTSYTNNWVGGVASSGTFVKNSAATWNVTGAYGIPSGWTVQTVSS